MAYNYTVPLTTHNYTVPPQLPTCCPMCASYHSGGTVYSQPNVSSSPCCCCYSQCCCCPQFNCQPLYQQPTNATNSKQRPNRRNKLTRSHSSCALGMDACGDAAAAGKGGPNERKRACPLHHSPYQCCSSSRPALRAGAQERGRRQSQPRHLPAPSCDLNRLMSMVRNPSRYEVTSEEEDEEEDSTIATTAPTTTDSEDVTEASSVSTLELDPRRESHSPERYRDINTRVRFLPPTSCLMLVKRADQQRMRKTDRQVQCCFDISSDFCSCSNEVCQFCAKKIVCTCPRIRCCMCAKLKSTADRKAHVVSVCRCPKTYRCCEMATSFLRFNSSPALTQGRNVGFECPSARGRPLTF